MTRVEVLRRLKARLEAGLVNVACYVDEAEIPARPGSYVLLSPSAGARTNTTMAARHEGQSWPFSALCVGLVKEVALDVAEQVDDLLIGWDLDPDSPSTTTIQDDGVEAPLISGGVAGDARVSLTRFYRLSTDRR